MDIALYGNLTIDTVIKDNEVYKSIGSIGNVWDAIIKLDQSKSVQIEPIEYGEALVYVDTTNGTKVSRPNLQLRYRTPTLLNAQWSHISYINRIRDLNFINSIRTSIISADIAGNVEFDFDILSHVDYLFVADDENKHLSTFLDKVKTAVIVHSKTGSITYTTNGNVLHHHTTTLSGKNILGAGDYFAAAFIIDMLNGKDLTASLNSAHFQTFRHLNTYE